MQGMQNTNNKQANTGFTLLELMLVICIVGVLAAIFMGRVGVYQEMAERAAMQQVKTAVQTALILQMANYLARGQDKQIRELTEKNPINLLLQKPANYAGEIRMGRADSVAPGNWAYDITLRELVYVPGHIENFKSGNDKEKWIRFQVRVLSESSGKSGSSTRKIEGLILVPVVPYEWDIKG